KAAPEHVALYACALRRAGQVARAVAAARRALEIDPLNYLALNELELLGESTDRDAIMRGVEGSYIELAAYYEDAGLFDDAARVLEHFRTAVSGDSCSALVFYHLGWCNGELGRLVERDAFWKTAAASEPDHVFASRREDMCALEAALAENPDDGLARYLLGNMHAWRARHDDAMDEWKRALGNGLGDYAVLLRNIAQTYLAVYDRPAEARRFYRAAIEAAPADEELYEEADEAFARSRNINERIAVLEGGAKAAPDSQKIHRLLARGYFFAGRYDDALECLMSRSYDRWENDRLVYRVYKNSHLEKGRAALHGRRYEEALDAFGKSMEYPENLKIGKPANPRHAPQLYLAGVAREALGSGDKAAELWAQGAAETHRGWDGFVCEEGYYKALCLLKIGRTRDAQRHLRTMTKGLRGIAKRWRGPAYDDFIRGLGYQGLEQWPQAVAHFQKALGYDRTNRTFKYHLRLARRKKQAGA
ncbi:MAG: tetratricopeptide repeat protein, partial [Planctomycetota bacterium]